jgi:transcriptional regulator with XRE-family HTH domain
MSGRGRPRTDIHERVVARYRQGEHPAEIARRLKVTRQWVSAILKGAGIDTRADNRKAYAARVERVRRELKTESDAKIIAARLGLKLYQVYNCCATLCRQGLRKP